MHTKKQRIANTLKHYRRLRGYSQKDVTTILGFKNTNRLSRWEKGTAFPNTQNLFKLSRLYRTFPNELLNDVYKAQVIKIDAAENEFIKNNPTHIHVDSP